MTKKKHAKCYCPKCRQRVEVSELYESYNGERLTRISCEKCNAEIMNLTSEEYKTWSRAN